jgi:hypothetical protein
VEFYQLKVEYNTLVIDKTINPKQRIKAIDPQDFHSHAAVVERGITSNDIRSREFLKTERGDRADFRRWTYDTSKKSFQSISIDQLLELEDVLKPLFKKMTYDENGKRVFNELFDVDEISSRVRLAFHARQELKTKSEIIPQSAEMLIVEKLGRVASNRSLYPNEADTKRIIEFDKSGKTIEEVEETMNEAYRQYQEALSGLSFQPAVEPGLSEAVRSKDRTFHFLPYDFTQSRFELEFLKQAIVDSEVQRRNLELYYNGERNLTNFKIQCFEQTNGSWSRVGEYTPDFLLLERRRKMIHRAIIIETKGSGFADQKGFAARKRFMETEFLRMNNEKYGYRRFDYLYLSDADDMATVNLPKLNTAIVNFFTD